MTSQTLLTTFLDSVRVPHYVNGRVLAAEDLQADRDAVLTLLSQVGQAAGPGVVDGLMVSTAGPRTIQVGAGLGLNRAGQSIHLAHDTTLPLSLTEPSPSATDTGRFQDCNFAGTATTASVPDGSYLLTVQPASRLDALVPVATAPGSGDPGGCVAKWELEGIQFNAIRLTAFDTGVTDVSDDTRRNVLAHWLYGSLALSQVDQYPFTFDDRFGGLDALTDTDLSPAELPLAVFRWSSGALAFVDLWSARRRLVRPDPLTIWRGLLSDKRVADGQARFLQFQDELDDVLAAGVPRTVHATQYFSYLPAAGFLPVGGRDPVLLGVVEVIVMRFAARIINAVRQNKLLEPFAAEIWQRIQTQLADLSIQILGSVSGPGVNLQTFFGDLLPGTITFIDRATLDITLQNSWRQEALILERHPRIDILVVGDLILPLVAANLGPAVTRMFTASAGGDRAMLFRGRYTVWEQIVSQATRDTLREMSGQELNGSNTLVDAGTIQPYVMFARSIHPSESFSWQVLALD